MTVNLEFWVSRTTSPMVKTRRLRRHSGRLHLWFVDPLLRGRGWWSRWGLQSFDLMNLPSWWGSLFSVIQCGSISSWCTTVIKANYLFIVSHGEKHHFPANSAYVKSVLCHSFRNFQPDMLKLKLNSSAPFNFWPRCFSLIIDDLTHVRFGSGRCQWCDCWCIGRWCHRSGHLSEGRFVEWRCAQIDRHWGFGDKKW